MKKLLILALVLASGISAVRAQSFYFKLEVDSLPSTHSWDNYTDYSESGHLTHSFGTDTSFMGLSVSPWYDDKKTSISNDTFVFVSKREFSYDPHGRLTLVFDNVSKHLRYFEFMLTPGDDYTRKTALLFKAENIDLVETATTLEFQLTGNEILQHHVFDSSYDYSYQQSGNMSFQTISVSRDSVVPGSTIHFTISKDHFATNSIGTESSKSIFVYPNPADEIVSIATNAQQMPIELYDVLGNKVSSRSVDASDETVTLNISAFPSGLYWVRIGNITKPLVIRH